MDLPDYKEGAYNPDGTHQPVTPRELSESEHMPVVFPYVIHILNIRDTRGIDLLYHLVRLSAARFAIKLGNTSEDWKPAQEHFFSFF